MIRSRLFGPVCPKANPLGKGTSGAQALRSDTFLSSPSSRLSRLVLLLGVGLLLLSLSARGTDLRGEYGGDLRFLIRYYHPPRLAGESNHYIDLWDGNKLHQIVRSGGLTNNRALFINSHGVGHQVGRSKEYAYSPHERLLNGARPPHFSTLDIATIVGTNALQIHNIVVAGCDTDDVFAASDLRKLFPNATNITHVVGGKAGYQPMYLQAIFSPAEDIDPLYEVEQRDQTGARTFRLTSQRQPRATKLLPYIAELFRPNANKPFRTQIAGRELLQSPATIVTLAESRPRQ